jgi:type IV secretion system protein VirB6
MGDKNNFILDILNSVELAGRHFTVDVYGVLSAYLLVTAFSLCVLSVIFWGFNVMLGRESYSVSTLVARLLRMTLILAALSGWGPLEWLTYQAVVQAPIGVSAAMMNNIVDPGNGAMSARTVVNDLNAFYNFALITAVRIDAAASSAPAQSSAPANAAATSANVAIMAGKNPLDVVLNSSIQAGIVWMAATLFVAAAVFLLIFSEPALMIMLALGPVFILSLIFPVSSRFFSRWVTATIQTMLAPIFLYAFLGFYLIAIKQLVLSLRDALNYGGMPMMKDVAPLVAACVAGLFLVLQVIPLAVRLGASSASLALGVADSALTLGRNALQTGLFRANAQRAAMQGATAGFFRADLEDRNLAVARQKRNR